MKKEKNDAKIRKTMKKEQIAADPRVSPRGAQRPTEQTSTSAVRKDLMTITPSNSESTKLWSRSMKGMQSVAHFEVLD